VNAARPAPTQAMTRSAPVTPCAHRRSTRSRTMRSRSGRTSRS